MFSALETLVPMRYINLLFTATLHYPATCRVPTIYSNYTRLANVKEG